LHLKDIEKCDWVGSDPYMRKVESHIEELAGKVLGA